MPSRSARWGRGCTNHCAAGAAFALLVVLLPACDKGSPPVAALDAAVAPAASTTPAPSARAASTPTTVASAEAGAGPTVSADGGTRAAATPYSTAVLAAKPIAYYRFEDPEGTDVESDVGGQKYQAKIKGNVTHVPGALGPSGGNAVHFSGAGGSIEAAPRSFLFPKDESFVLELWVRPAAPPDQSARRVLELGAGTKDSYFLTYGGTSSGSTGDDAMDNLYFAVSWQGDGFDMAGCVSPKIPMNAWTYVVMDFGNAAEMYLFVNAKQAGLWHVGEPSRVPAAAARFFLGSDPQGKNVFDGDIDEVAIYRSSLDQKTMAAHYAAAGRH